MAYMPIYIVIWLQRIVWLLSPSCLIVKDPKHFDNNEDGGNNILQYANQCGEDLETIRITSIVDANTHSKLKDPKHFEVSQDILFYCNDDEDNNILQHAKQFEYLETIRIMSMTMPIFIQNLKIPNTLNFHRTFLTIVRMKIL